MDGGPAFYKPGCCGVKGKSAGRPDVEDCPVLRGTEGTLGVIVPKGLRTERVAAQEVDGGELQGGPSEGALAGLIHPGLEGAKRGSEAL